VLTKLSPEELIILPRLRAAGIPLDGEVVRELTESKRLVGKFGSVVSEEIVIEQRDDCILTELDHYLIGYILDVRIIIRLRGTTTIVEHSLELPQHDKWFRWLPDPAEGARSNAVYRFPGDSAHSFPRETVLNHRMRGPFRCGDVLECRLLGISNRPIDKTLCSGAETPAVLKLIDQLSQPHSATLILWVDRAERPEDQTRAKRKRIFAKARAAKGGSSARVRRREPKRGSQRQVSAETKNHESARNFRQERLQAEATPSQKEQARRHRQARVPSPASK